MKIPDENTIYFYIFLPNFQTRYVQFLVKLLSGSTKYNYVYEDFELYIFEQKNVETRVSVFQDRKPKIQREFGSILKVA